MFSIKEAIVFGWHKLKANSALVFGVVLTLFALEIFSSIIEKSLENTPAGAVLSIIFSAAGIVLGAGMTYIFLRLARSEAARYRDIVPAIRIIWKYFATSVITTVIALLPLAAGVLVSLAFLVPTGSIHFSESMPPLESNGWVALAALLMLASFVAAIYLGLRYSMAQLYAIDGADIIESLRASAKLTRGIKWRLVLFGLAVLALNLLGLLALVVGLLVSVPVSMFAFTHVYLKRKEALH